MRAWSQPHCVPGRAARLPLLELSFNTCMESATLRARQGSQAAFTGALKLCLSYHVHMACSTG